MEQLFLLLKVSINGCSSLFYYYLLLILIISLISFIFTMIIKKIYTHLEYSYYEKIIFPFIAPGIIIHEFFHLIIGLMVGLKPKKIHFFEIKSGMGYVQFYDASHKYPLLYLDMIMAPFIFGVFLVNVLLLEITSRNVVLGLKFLMIWLLLSIISPI